MQTLQEENLSEKGSVESARRLLSEAPARGGKGGRLPPPMLKKMALAILPNSMRKIGGGGKLIFSDVKKSQTLNISCDNWLSHGLFYITGSLFRIPESKNTAFNCKHERESKRFPSHHLSDPSRQGQSAPLTI